MTYTTEIVAYHRWLRHGAACIASLFLAPVSAQITTAPNPTPVTRIDLMPPSKVYVDTTKIPKKRKGYNTIRIKLTGCDTGIPNAHGNDNGGGYPSGTFYPGCNAANSVVYDTNLGNNAGAFRLFCPFSHIAFDDPIVWPGEAGRTHAHAFYGNVTTNFRTDITRMDQIGDSTCFGGILNRTGYWAPFFVYHCEAPFPNGCNPSRNGEIKVAAIANFYYKTFSLGAGTVVWAPKGLRMIAGDPNNTTVAGMASGQVEYECWDGAATPVGLSQNVGNPYTNSAPPQSATVVTLAGTSLTINSGNSATYNGKVIETTSASSVTITINTGAGLTQNLLIRQLGAGVVTINGSSTLTNVTPTNGVQTVRVISYAGAADSYNVYKALPYRFDHIPTSAEAAALTASVPSGGTCVSVKMNITFPTCMKAVDILDSPDHKSHMAYPNYALSPACPTGFTARLIPNHEALYHFPTNATELDSWRLSSDYSRKGAIDAALDCATADKNYCAGFSGHGDWVNGWDQTTTWGSTGMTIPQLIAKNCYPSVTLNPHGASCTDQLLGDLNSDGKHWWMY